MGVEMGYDANKPVTTGNCPTRTALERKPGEDGFLADSIHATHTDKKRQQHLRNVEARRMNKGRKS